MKKLVATVCFSLLLCMTAITAYANAPAPPNHFYCNIENAPQNAAYLDILIEITPHNDEYSAFNSQENNISADSQIALYNENGYMSLSFHYKNISRADMGIAYPYFIMDYYNQSIDKISPTIKAVILDKEGNILQISDAISTVPETTDEFARTLTYNANEAAPVLQFNHYYKGSSHPFYYLLSLLIILFRMALSVGIETFAAIPFKIHPIWKITVINILTQTMLILFMMFSGLSYLTALIIGEVFVYISEFIAYILLYKSIPKWKIAIYTIAANTITLIMGLLMNSYNILV